MRPLVSVYQNQESVGLAIRESGLSRAELYLTSKWGFGNIHDALNESLTKVYNEHVQQFMSCDIDFSP
jgi:diketogulonate reductase-like aldo/keto reductase